MADVIKPRRPRADHYFRCTVNGYGLNVYKVAGDYPPDIRIVDVGLVVRLRRVAFVILCRPRQWPVRRPRQEA